MFQNILIDYFNFKRIMDILISFIGIIFLLPFFIFIIIIIQLDSKGSSFFKQKRVGTHKINFNILKFRTMRIETPKDTPTHQLNNPSKYITNVGKLLRKTSIDELPQIWNILIGQMSFIGPRPALWSQYDLISEREKNGANDIRPGLTGWAQINGRDELPIKKKAKLDGEYVQRMCLWIDIKCFLKTIFKVLKHEGVVEGGLQKEIVETKEKAKQV